MFDNGKNNCDKSRRDLIVIRKKRIFFHSFISLELVNYKIIKISVKRLSGVNSNIEDFLYRSHGK